MRISLPGCDAHHPELPDPLFARLKARASTERLTLKQLLRSYVEQGLSATPSGSGSKRSAWSSSDFADRSQSFTETIVGVAARH